MYYRDRRHLVTFTIGLAEIDLEIRTSALFISSLISFNVLEEDRYK